MAEEKENMTPETEEDQDTSKDLLFGKFKSMEEAEAAYKKMESERGEMNERLDRTERLLALIKPDQGSTSTQSGTPEGATAGTGYEYDLGYDEEESKRYQAMEKRIEDRVKRDVLDVVQRAVSEQELRRRHHDAFFKSNPDLVGAEELVIQEARSLMSELGDKRIDDQEGIKEVARRVREKIARWTKAKKKPMHLEEGRSVTPEKVDTQEEEGSILTQEEKLAEFMEDKKKQKEKMLGG